MALEQMSSFFAARVDGYDEHMINDVEWCKEGYIKVGEIVSEYISTCDIDKRALNLLDLGCGTGLELDEIFKRIPNIKVTGIDLTQDMLNKLHHKHIDKDISLICGSYFDVDFSNNIFNVAISF